MPGIVPGPAPSPGSAPPPQAFAGDIAQAAALDPRELARMCVHMLMDAKPGRPWQSAESRQSRFVFIGRHLDREALQHGFLECVHNSYRSHVAQPIS